MIKQVTIVILVLAVLFLGASFLPLEFLRGRVEAALGQGLGRKVEIGAIHLTLLSSPGVTLDAVTIHEDPSAGIEPFAYAGSVDARVDLLALLRGRFTFSSLRFDEASLNLVKPEHGPWNFETLLSRSGTAVAGRQVPRPMPAIQMRSGRVNLKFGDTKSIVYFDDSDLDIHPRREEMEIRFSGMPARTDRSAQTLGHFFVRGIWKGNDLNLNAELEPTSLDGLAHLFVAGPYQLKGSVALEASINGPREALAIDGNLRLQGGGTWRYRGNLDVPHQNLDVASLPQPDAAIVRIHAKDFLDQAQVDVLTEEAPLKGVVTLAAKLGAQIPPELLEGENTQGTLAGSLALRGEDGLSGNFEFSDVTLRMKNAPPIHAATATLLMKRNKAQFGPVTTTWETEQGKETAEIQAVGQVGEGGGWEASLSTKRLSLSSLRALPLGEVPVMERLQSGAGFLRGVLHFEQPNGEAFAWSGDYELQNVQLNVEGLGQSVNIQTATVSAKPENIDVTRIRAQAGTIPFAGEYHWIRSEKKEIPQRFRLQLGEARGAALEELFSPTLDRKDGIVARTLRIGSEAAPPEWLAKRSAEGDVAIQSLDVNGHKLRASAVHIVWEGSSVRIKSSNARLDDALLAGELRVNLAAASPAFHWDGTLSGFPWKGGAVDFTSTADAAGKGREILASVRAEGTFRGRTIAFSPEAEFRQSKGRFWVHMVNGSALWDLSELELQQGADTYTGRGVTQAGGKIILDLVGAGRQVRYTGWLAGPPQA